MEHFLKIDDLLSEEERIIRNNVRRFANEKIIPQIVEAYEQGEFLQNLIPELAKLGILGMTLPERYGGSAASYISYGLACQELERGDSGTRSFVSVQSSLCMYPIFRYGTEDQKRKFLPLMAAGNKIGCFGLTEPDAGSDPASMKTTAKKTQDGWLLNGSKLWISNATIADLAIVWASTDEGIRGFIVERDFPGFSANAIKHKMSLRASDTGELIFADCFVPDSHYLPGSDKGLTAPLSCLTQARYGVAWGAMGAAQACYEIAVDYAKTRKQFNKAIASKQLVQKDLADMFCEIVKAQMLNLRVGQLFDKGEYHFSHISLAKMNSCAQAIKIARMARNILGANGISLEYHVIRHMNNLESVFTYEGTDNVHHLILGQYITDINAF